MSCDNSEFGLENIMSNYWHSRGLIVTGMLLAYYCPFPALVLPFVLLVDLLYQNPTLPMNIGVGPQELMSRIKSRIQEQYARLIELYGLFRPGQKQKKME